MTIIAWDGKTLAADKQSGDEWTKYGRTTKIRRIRDCLVGAAGNAAMNREMFAWFEAGAIAAELPDEQREIARCSSLLVITPEGLIRVYQNGGFPLDVENPYYAIGSGKEAASAVLELGFDAVRAVEIASIVCTGCGGGVDILTL